MKLHGALILMMSLSGAGALTCYTCIAAIQETCTDTTTCGALFDRCYSMEVGVFSMVTKGCQNSVACVDPIKCCEGNLCNDAVTTGPSVKMLLVLSPAIIALFL